MTVQVEINGFKMRGTYIIADSVSGIVKLNDNVVNFDANEFVNEIQDIVKSWKPKMINHRVLDGMWYFVKINDGINERVFDGRNKFPANFNRFKELVKCVEKSQ